MEAWLDATGVNLTRTGRIGYDRALALARNGLDEATFTAARETGRAMRPEAILAEVNRESTPGAGIAEGQRAVTARSTVRPDAP